VITVEPEIDNGVVYIELDNGDTIPRTNSGILYKNGKLEVGKLEAKNEFTASIGSITQFTSSISTITTLNTTTSSHTNLYFGRNTELLTSITGASGGVTLDLTMSNNFQIDAIGNITITFQAPTVPINRTYGFVVTIIRSSSNFTVGWPISVRWPNGTAPVLQGTGTRDVFSFFTNDNGSTYYGMLVGGNI
jgi:hypothetical protein